MNANLRWFYLLALVLLAGSVGGAWLLLHPSGNAAPPSPPAPPAGRKAVVCLGRVDVEAGVAALAPLQPGRVAEVCVRENDEVEPGIVLLRLDDTAARLRVAEAEVALKTARSRLELARKQPERQRLRQVQQEAALEAAQHRRAAAAHVAGQKKRLSRGDLVSAAELAAVEEQRKELEALEKLESARLAELGLSDPVREVGQAELEVEALEVKLRQARQALEEYGLKAPQAGTVLRILVAAGDVLPNASKPAAVWFAAKGPRLVRAEVDQEFAPRLAVGLPAQVADEAPEGATWKGRVVRIAEWFSQRRTVLNEPFQINDVRTVECLIGLDDGPSQGGGASAPQAPLPRIGQRVRVTIGPTTP